MTYRYIQIDKAKKISCSVIESDVERTDLRETDDCVWRELDSAFDGYLMTEVIINDDLSISPDTATRDARVALETHEERWRRFPTIRKQLYALYKDRKGDSTLLDQVTADMDDVVDELGEDV